jgi:lactoylglutathione lyase
MIAPIRGLFETHLAVADLRRSMDFYSGILGLDLARVFPERKVAFYWIGGPGEAMLGLWDVGTCPQQIAASGLHFRSA